MQIFVGKNGQQLGPFSLEELNRKLADGTFAGTDLGWYEGAAGWAPLSGIAGVVVPAPATPATPAPTPTPAPISPAPVPTPTPAPVTRASTPIVQPATARAGGYKTLSLVSWILLGVTFLISFVPFLGCGTWILAWPVAVAAIVMGIIVLTRGGTLQGILIILAGVLIVPLTLLGQFFSLALFGGTVDRQQQTQVLGNLRAIESAKSQYVSATNAAIGAPVTMANLTSYLTGREIKPAVEEQYDPQRVGLVPTATIPSGKTLGSFKGGDVVTAAKLEKSIASSSAFTWLYNQTSQAPSASPLASPQPTVASSPAVAPTASPSPRPSPAVSASPRPSSSPRSLISPRQAPDDPSSAARPSPSAKFAPRDGPRTGPRDTPSDPEQSGGLKQGRQFPREGPSPSPEDEDE